jgi:hypothetical protein
MTAASTVSIRLWASPVNRWVDNFGRTPVQTEFRQVRQISLKPCKLDKTVDFAG